MATTPEDTTAPWDTPAPVAGAAGPAPWETPAPVAPPTAAQSETAPWESAPPTAAPTESVSTPAAPVSYEAVQKTMHRPASASPGFASERVTDQELQAIAKKHGVDPQGLKKIAPLFGAITEGIEQEPSELGMYAAGTAGRVLGGVPQWIAKKLQTDQKLRDSIDDIRELADRKRSWTSFGGELLAPAGLGGGAAAATESVGKAVGKGAAVGGAVGVAGSREGEEIPAATTGAALGGIVSGLVQKIASPGKALTAEDARAVKYLQGNQNKIEEGTDKLLAERKPAEEILRHKVLQGKNDYLSKEGVDSLVEHLAPEDLRQAGSEATQIARGESAALLDRAPGEMAETLDRQKIAGEILEDRTKSFARELGEEKPSTYTAARQVIQNAVEKDGEEVVARRYDNFLREKTALDYIHTNEIQAVPEGYRPLRVGSNAVGDAKFTIRQIGEKHGLDLENIHNDLSENYNKMAFAKGHAADEMNNLAKLAKGSGIDLQSDVVYDAIAGGKALPEEHQQVADQVRKLFQETSGEAKPISMPQMVKDPEDFIRAMHTETQDLLGNRKFTDLPAQEFSSLRKSSPSFDSLVRGLELFSEEKISTPQGAQNAYVRATSPFSARPRLEAISQAVETGGVPDFLREKNIMKLYDRFTNSILRKKYLSEDIGRLASKARVLKKLGDDTSAHYIERLVGDISGARQRVSSTVFQQAALQYTTTLDRAADRVGRNSLAGQTILAAKAMPDLLSALSHNVYVNLLGANPRTLIQNATQTMTKLAPELGGTYGYSTTLKAALGASMNMKSLARRLEEGGYVAPEFRPEHLDALSKGIQQSSLVRLPARALRAASTAAMYLFQKLEQMNRMITLQAADIMTHDLLVGKSSEAFKALQKAPTAIQRAVQQGISTGDARLVNKALASHLISSTQFHYNKINMSEFGRIMGPAFSAFSKWPTATYGDIVGELQSRGALRAAPRLFGKYVAPLALLSGMGYLVHGAAGEMSDTQKRIYGRAGLAGSAPLASLGGVLTGDVFTPPMIQATWSAVAVPALRGDLPKMENGIASAVQNFMPGGFIVRFLTDDLVTYGTGSRPQGNFFDRTLEGAERLSK